MPSSRSPQAVWEPDWAVSPSGDQRFLERGEPQIQGQPFQGDPLCAILGAIARQARAMIARYFDESADGSAKEISVVAGVLGRNYAWIQMETRWRKLLAEYDLAYYHAV